MMSKFCLKFCANIQWFNDITEVSTDRCECACVCLCVHWQGVLKSLADAYQSAGCKGFKFKTRVVLLDHTQESTLEQKHM